MRWITAYTTSIVIQLMEFLTLEIHLLSEFMIDKNDMEVIT
uniref:Uncharacterized protein n=1 Tax=Rhizophora mucronata TaxID=61149 RepID=A0A2P2KG08_RHIMU